mgnify:CR=1 FL=1
MMQRRDFLRQSMLAAAATTVGCNTLTSAKTSPAASATRPGAVSPPRNNNPSPAAKKFSAVTSCINERPTHTRL